jgi:cell division protein ZapA
LTKTVEIEIYGQRYTVQGEADEEHVKRIAAYVDQHMRGLAAAMKTATLPKLAVLAALNIAHQWFESEQRRQQDTADVERKAVGLLESIDEQLQPSRTR